MTIVSEVLLTIVVEASIEREIIRELHSAGVRGFTAVEAVGIGTRGHTVEDWGLNKSLRIEAICDRETAAGLAERLLSRWERDHAIVLWFKDVEVPVTALELRAS